MQCDCLCKRRHRWCLKLSQATKKCMTSSYSRNSTFSFLPAHTPAIYTTAISTIWRTLPKWIHSGCSSSHPTRVPSTSWRVCTVWSPWWVALATPSLSSCSVAANRCELQRIYWSWIWQSAISSCWSSVPLPFTIISKRVLPWEIQVGVRGDVFN